MRQGRNQLEEGEHRRAALPEDRSGCPAPILPISRHCLMLAWRPLQHVCDRKQLLASIVQDGLQACKQVNLQHRAMHCLLHAGCQMQKLLKWACDGADPPSMQSPSSGMLVCLSSAAAEVRHPSSELMTASICALQYVPSQSCRAWHSAGHRCASHVREGCNRGVPKASAMLQALQAPSPVQPLSRALLP